MIPFQTTNILKLILPGQYLPNLKKKCPAVAQCISSLELCKLSMVLHLAIDHMIIIASKIKLSLCMPLILSLIEVRKELKVPREWNTEIYKWVIKISS